MALLPILIVNFVILLSLSFINADFTPYYFDQIIDHFGTSLSTFPQRYYKDDSNFGGPGNPIFCIMGGEGGIPPEVGLYYPWIYSIVAKEFKALVIEPEHRFYGESLPFGNNSFSNTNLQLLNIPQALADTANFITSIRLQYNCSLDSTNENYCPVITVGGSYPGCLSALMRIRYPNVVQIAYAASAPLLYYTQTVDQYAYYSIITNSAERSLPGCSYFVRNAIDTVLTGQYSMQEVATKLNLCSIPEYVQNNSTLFFSELVQIVAVQFANLNMENYPPNNTTGLYSACSAISTASDPFSGLAAILSQIIPTPNSCFDMTTQIPAGPDSTVACGDFSGCGSGRDGEMWDYETCTFEIQAIGTNGKTDMFTQRPYSMDWLIQHCSRFGATPQPNTLANLWGIDNLAATGASKIIFTNGLNDGWSAAGFQTSLSDTLISINMPNGAHHSDLQHILPNDNDTSDIVEARAQAIALIKGWLNMF